MEKSLDLFGNQTLIAASLFAMKLLEFIPNRDLEIL